ncbi:hypothetical protein [Fibrella forsythiae]|uniref:Uncharacterized protein n=1 Tax=Fibrella forsythiae TaxID=2817061 RepID=A0ABS3JM90_9BACT|nr:hypothetical protein [Fibrella forsythiae]MBO0950027.1 hypothetical protein [Fibrella forsythiae]
MIANAELPTKPDLIPGIYNYCDSWCERCPLTNRCRSFQLQQESGIKAPDPNTSLVEQLTEALNMTKQYIDTLHKASSSFLPATPSSDEKMTLEEAVLNRRHQTKDHPVATLATSYLKQTGSWLLIEKGLLERAGQQQLRDVQLGIRTEDEAMILLNNLRDAYEQIRWYRTLIPVKTKAALRAVEEQTDDEYLLSYYDGKAKLVLVSIDQSLKAWQTVMAYYPETTDDLLNTLSILSRLGRQIEMLFPNARAFKRPGLD